MFTPAKKTAKRFKIALYGDAKTGKSIAALSFPKPAVADCEKGSLLYADEYDFVVKEINSFREFEMLVNWIAKQKDPGFETFIVDPVTVLWQDLMDTVALEVANRGRHHMSQGDWGVIKRAWNRVMYKLLGLNLHVILVVREKDETETVDEGGKKEFYKTGNVIMDAEKNLKYLFDFIVRTEMEEFIKGKNISAKGKKKIKDKEKEARYFVTIKGSRRKELPRYARYEVTNKKVYKTIFEPVAKIVSSGAKMEPVKEEKEDPKPEPKPDKKATKEPAGKKTPGKKTTKKVVAKTPAELEQEIKDTFASTGDPASKITNVELRQFYGGIGQLKWPNGEAMNEEDGKQLAYRRCKIETMKDMTVKQFNDLMDKLGLVAAGRLIIKRANDDNRPYLAKPATATAAKS
jgi:hypothetical protein